ncbi:hypothetical protein ACFV8E_23955 [Streptomyces sp. NPDC059849]|uniref:hypothetical protein n=1 Tax=Streptomyces sp. NPDC059849 TaxID=3346969 RepID=UPI003651C423
MMVGIHAEMKPRKVWIVAVLLAVALTSCIGPGPSSVRFGYRLDGRGNVVIAYPLCPAGEVSGAEITVRVQRGEVSSFKRLWKARGAVSDEVKRGVFTVGTPDSFRQESKPLAGELPKGFFVEVEELSRGGGSNDGRDDWIDLSVQPSRPLKAGEYLTSDGEIVSWQWVNNQLGCGKKT